ncbi:MAG TPA: glutamyl-tRNA reductase [Chitinophagaceae bacterium]|jgi:glutamyl-tRNA reductase|nr:glutamyl-tRNA reductase [Chitinophagaceae bacterium]
MVNPLKDISKFWIAGINYKKTDAGIRGQFAIQDEQYANLLKQALANGLNEVFVLSTCNRTEIYGFADNVSQLINLLCAQTAGSKETFSELAYIKRGEEAIEHLFYVSAGLDSQILGDYEIVGQVKTAVKFSKKHGCMNVLLERLVNTVLQSSKAIKNQTELSGGTVSVSFAAVQYIRQHVKAVADKKILLLGTGKIGRNTCKNLVDYLKTKNITLINRTEEKAAELAKELGLKHASLSELPKHIATSDIILVATDSTEPTILYSHLEDQNNKLVLDLSIPYNVEAAAQELSHITLINVDELSKLKDETLAKREAEAPKAKLIVAEHITEFLEWYDMRKHVPVLKAVKTKLKEIHKSPLFIPLYNNSTHTEEKIQRVINGMAYKMKGQNQKGCQYIEAINEFIATGTN